MLSDFCIQYERWDSCWNGVHHEYNTHYKVPLRDGVDLVSQGRRKSKGGNTFRFYVEVLATALLLLLLLYASYTWYEVRHCV